MDLRRLNHVVTLADTLHFARAAEAQRAADSLKYKVGDIEVFSLFDGATSLDDAIASIDSLKRSTRQNERLLVQMRRTQASVCKL